MRSRAVRPLAPRKRRKTDHAPRVESLEGRQLLAASIAETPLLAGFVLPGQAQVARTSDGALWTAEYPTGTASEVLTRTDAQGHSAVAFQVPANLSVKQLVSGADGAVWALVTPYFSSPDWSYGRLYKITKDYNVTIDLPEYTDSVAVDASGNAWTVGSVYTLNATPANSAQIREYNAKTALPVPANGAYLSGRYLTQITAASDGALWFREPEVQGVTRFVPRGSATSFPLDPAEPTLGEPVLVAGSGGRIWVGANSVSDQFTLTSLAPDGTRETVGVGQALANYSLGTGASLAASPDGSIWFLNTATSAVGRATADGQVAQYPTAKIVPFGGAVTSDGASGAYYVTYGEDGGPYVAHLTTDAPETGVVVHARSIVASEAGVPAATPLATFTTTDPSAFSFHYIARYQIDGTAPHDGLILADGNGGYVVQAVATGEPQAPGTHMLTVTVIDAKHGNTIGSSASSFAVATINAAPVSVQGKTISVSPGVAFTDPVATIVNPGTPVNSQVTIDWGDGSTPGTTTVGTGDVTYAHTFAVPGIYTVTITANHNGVITTGTSTANVTVPAITSITPSVVGFSQEVWARKKVATFETASPSNPGNYSPTITQPDGQRMTAEVIQSGPTSYEIWASGSFRSFGEIPLTVQVQPFMGPGATTSTIATAIVTPTPITASAVTFTAHATAPVSAIVANFLIYGSAEHSATIDWGDGTTSPGRVVWPGAEPGIVSYSVAGDHTYAAPGNHDVVVTIYGTQTGSDPVIVARVTSHAVVDAAFLYATGASVTAVVDRPWVGYAASFGTQATDLPASGVTATIHWGDGSPDSQGSVTGDGQGNYSVAGGHYFTRGGQYDATVDFRLPDGTTATAHTTFKAEMPPFVATGTTLSGTQGSPVSGVLATILDGDRGLPSDYAATIDWGDGTKTTGQISAYLDQLVVFGQHTYATPGTYTYTLTMLKGTKTEIPVTAGGKIAVAPATQAGTPGSGGQVGGGTTTPPAALTILGARSTRNRKGAVRVTLTLDGTIDAAKAADKATFTLTDPGKDGKIGTRDDRAVRIASAKYDAASHTVTLTPRGSFSRTPRFRVGMRGTVSVTATA